MTLQIKLARTLWYNTYRGKVTGTTGDYVASLRLIPSVPLEREEVPPDAPVVAPYVTVLVEDGAFASENLVEFERQVSDLLLAQMAQPGFAPEYCEFVYPSPASLLAEQSESSGPMVTEI